MTVLRPFANPAVRSPRRRAGFTIVELLVVISVIAILISLLSVGIVQAGGTARQTKALSGLKQIGTAWSQYAAQNEDRAMPGYMDDGVQAAFKIKVRNAAGDRVDPQFCRTYPFRLLPFLDNERTILEMIDFDNAIGVGLEFARARGDTLVLVTCDHGHAFEVYGTVDTAVFNSYDSLSTDPAAKKKLRELSLRTVLKIADLKRSMPTNWRAVAEVTCMRRA